MSIQLLPLILLVFAPVDIILSVYAWLHRKETPGALLVAWYMLGAGLVSFGYGMELLSTTLEWKLTWVGLRYIGNTGITAPITLLLALWYTGHTSWLKPRKALLLFVLPFISLVGFFTNPAHHLHYVTVGLDYSGPMVMLAKTNGPLYNLMILYILVYLALGTGLAFWAVFSLQRLYFWQALGIFLGTGIPTALTVAYLAGWKPVSGINLTPLGYVFSSFTFWWIILRHRLFEISPITFHVLFEHIPTGVIVLDTQQRITSINPAALKELDLPLPEILGLPVEKACTPWPAMLAWLADQAARSPLSGAPVDTGNAVSQSSNWEIVPHWRTDQQFMLQLTPMQNGSQMILITDVTRQQAAEQALRQQQNTMAALAEREKLGRDLHDGVGQLTGFVSIQSQAARQYLASGQTEMVDATLALLQDAAREAHADVRSFILGLHGGQPGESSDQTAGGDFYTDLERYIVHFNTVYGMSASLMLPERRPFLAPDVALQVVRIVQEALSNVRKHAGTQAARVSVQAGQSELFVQVEDEGSGFDPALPAERGHFGRGIMAERAAQIGARLDIHSRSEAGPGRGTRVSLSLVLAPVEPAVATGLSELRALLVDDQELFRTGLRSLLAARGVQVVGEAGDGRQALEMARQRQPNLVLMDLDMPEMDGLEATRQIHQESPATRVVILTVAASSEMLVEALRAGAVGYLLKDLQARELFELLESLGRGESPVAPSLAGRALQELAGTAQDGSDSNLLTERQIEILRLAARGLTNLQIAARLSLSEATVKYHFHLIFERLQVQSREQAITAAARRGWVNRRGA